MQGKLTVTAICVFTVHMLLMLLVLTLLVCEYIMHACFLQVKVQLQAQSNAPIAVGYQHHHEGMLAAFLRIYRENRLTGLWRGVTAALLRVGSGSAVQLSTFSKCKSHFDQFAVSGL